MNEEDYIGMYQEWLDSKRFKELQEALAHEDMMYIFHNPSDLLKSIKRKFEYYNTNLYMLEEYSTIDALIEKYRTHIIHLTINLKYNEVCERYELCSHIHSLINIKMECLETLAYDLFQPTEYDINEMETLDTLTRSIINEMWDEKKNLLEVNKK